MKNIAKTTTKKAKPATKVQNTAKNGLNKPVRTSSTNKSDTSRKVENKARKNDRSNQDNYDIKVTKSGNCYFNNKKITNSKDQRTVKKIGKLMKDLDNRLK